MLDQKLEIRVKNHPLVPPFKRVAEGEVSLSKKALILAEKPSLIIPKAPEISQVLQQHCQRYSVAAQCRN